MLNKKSVFIFLANGFEEIEAITTIDVLRRGNVTVSIISITGQLAVTGAHGVVVMADDLFENTNFEGAEMLILPGGMPGAQNLQEHSGLNTLLRQFDDGKKLLAAICAAPKVFGHLGLLKNRTVICYPGFEEELTGAKIALANVVTDGNITTAKGPGFAIEFGLNLVDILMGEKESDTVAKGLLVK